MATLWLFIYFFNSQMTDEIDKKDKKGGILMSTIMFPCLKVCEYIENEKPIGAIKVIDGQYGRILYFQATEKFGFKSAAKYRKFDFCCYEKETPALFERILKMKLVKNSFVEVSGSLQLREKMVNGMKYIDISVKVFSINFVSARPKEKNEKNLTENKQEICLENLPDIIDLDEMDIFIGGKIK